MTRAICVCFHKYTNFGAEFYEVLLDFFLSTMRKYNDEYDMLYICDSNWNINPEKLLGLNATIIKTDPHMRYYDTYKHVLPQIKEDLVLLLDNDMIIYKKDIIYRAFSLLIDDMSVGEEPEEYSPPFDVVSIMDTIGTWKSDELSYGNKFCPYWLATRKELIMKYVDVDWSPDMPNFETLGKLTKAMVEDGVKVYELEDDKNSIYFDGTEDGEKGKDLGYYHVRAGSTPAYLLSTKKYGNIDTYNTYLLEQPKREILRQLAWYDYMMLSMYVSIENPPKINIADFLNDLDINPFRFGEYMDKFKQFHGLE